MNRNQFQKAAKLFRAGRITLDEFTAQTFAAEKTANADEESGKPEPGTSPPLHPKSRFFERQAAGHKGDFGRCLMVGGSRNMPGAISLSGLAALKSGAGLVKIATTPSARPVVSSFDPALMAFEIDEDPNGFVAEETGIDSQNLAWADVIAVGPGLGKTEATTNFLRSLIDRFEGPMVIDADGLNSLAPLGEQVLPDNHRCVLTPHPGEFGRLFPDSASGDRESMINTAMTIAKDRELVMVLKGHQTFVTDGTRHSINPTGNAGMATAGSGDVLTGIIAALIGQGWLAWEAARLAVLVHGLAGDLAADDLGQVSMTATDLLSYLPDAFEQLRLNPGLLE